MSHRLCPSCGYNLEAERPVVSGRVTWDGFVKVDGRIFSKGQANSLIGSLLHAWPKSVSTVALWQRTMDEDVTIEAVGVLMVSVRQRLAKLGLPGIILTVPGGYQWRDAVQDREPERVTGIAERDEAICAMREHMSAAEVARHFGISRSTVYNVPARRGRPVKHATRAERDRAIADLYPTTTAAEIARTFGLRVKRVQVIAHRAGVRKQRQRNVVG